MHNMDKRAQVEYRKKVKGEPLRPVQPNLGRVLVCLSLKVRPCGRLDQQWNRPWHRLYTRNVYREALPARAVGQLARRCLDRAQ